MARARAAGHETIGVDLPRGEYDTPLPGAANPWPDTYISGDLASDSGLMMSCVARFKPDAIIHVAAIPNPEHSSPADVMRNNLMSTFNVVEAAVLLRVPRLVNVSSGACGEQSREETTAGYVWG